MMSKFFGDKFGQALVEVIISLAIVVIVAVGLISTTLVTQKSSRSAKADTQAAKLLQDYTEKVRILRDRNGFESLPAASASCYRINNGDNADYSTWALVTTSCPETKTLDNVSFTRKLVFSAGVNANSKLVTITVTWNDSGGTQTRIHSTIVSDCVQSDC